MGNGRGCPAQEIAQGEIQKKGERALMAYLGATETREELLTNLRTTVQARRPKPPTWLHLAGIFALGMAWRYLRSEKPRRNPAPRRSAINDAIRSKHGVSAFEYSGRPKVWALRDMADSGSVYASVARAQLRSR